MHLEFNFKSRSFSRENFDEISQCFEVFSSTVNKVEGVSSYIRGPVFLPNSRKLFTLHRAAHGDVTSREQRCVIIHKCSWFFGVEFNSKSCNDLLIKSLWLELLKEFDCFSISYNWSITYHTKVLLV